jgi:hypothetical protein
MSSADMAVSGYLYTIIALQYVTADGAVRSRLVPLHSSLPLCLSPCYGSLTNANYPPICGCKLTG